MVEQGIRISRSISWQNVRRLHAAGSQHGAELVCCDHPMFSGSEAKHQVYYAIQRRWSGKMRANGCCRISTYAQNIGKNIATSEANAYQKPGRYYG